ncbi:MAG: hypothetical protein K2H18_08560 [Muribaculaceae bacterium]|nr:hypothetical protein [Muribaculaceae bacterium]
MNKFYILLLGAVALPAPFWAQEPNDSSWQAKDIERDLNEVVVVSKRPAIKQAPDRIIYTVKNDPYASGLDGMEILNNIPRVSVINDQVSVAGKNNVRYIIDGHLLEMTDEAIAMKLKNLQANGIEKIELLTTPPAKYAAGNNVAFISITTRNESLGTRGNVWGNGRYSDKFSYMLGGNICHTTRKIEVSGDISWNDSKGKNDVFKSYIFNDYSRISNRRNDFIWRTLGLNGLFKYKFNKNLSAGIIVNFSNNRMRNDISDKTIENASTLISTTTVPFYPENALTLTGFADWIIDSTGKTLSLTYNRFDKLTN